MKFAFFLMFFFFFEYNIFAQNVKICWNTNKVLCWSDFRVLNSQENIDEGYSALSFCGIILKIKYDLVIPYFDKEKSWVLLSRKKSKILLSHEITHFDIVELFARKMRHEFDISTDKNFEPIYDRNIILLDSCQDRYDVETNHGIIESEQTCWNNYISDELKKLDKYKTTEKECNILKD